MNTLYVEMDIDIKFSILPSLNKIDDIKWK